MTFHDENVVYRSPRLHRAGQLLKGVFTSILLSGVAAACYWALLVPKLWGSNPPTEAHVAGAVIVLFVPFALWILANREEPSRLILRVDSIWMGGIITGRTLSYDDIRLVELEKPGGTLGKVHKLIVRGKSRRPRFIWLRTDEARQAFEALRGLANHAPAIDDQQQELLPDNPQFDVQARRALAYEFNRKAIRAYISSGVFACLALLLIATLCFGGQAARSRPKAWIGAVLFPVISVGSVGVAKRHRRKARAVVDD